MKIGALRDGTTPLPALIEEDRAYRLDDVLGAIGGAPVGFPKARMLGLSWQPVPC